MLIMNMYDERFVTPLREELTSIGFKELRTASEVDEVIGKSKDTLLCVVNSVCGCAAAGARPGVAKALNGEKKPNVLITVFAGQDKEATDRARSYFSGYTPSSPSIALFKDGKIVAMLERKDIEGNSADQIAAKLSSAFTEYC
jgi:putative YphP/YqiW family bacilliredoxin